MCDNNGIKLIYLLEFAFFFGCTKNHSQSHFCSFLYFLQLILWPIFQRLYEGKLRLQSRPSQEQCQCCDCSVVNQDLRVFIRLATDYLNKKNQHANSIQPLWSSCGNSAELSMINNYETSKITTIISCHFVYRVIM